MSFYHQDYSSIEKMRQAWAGAMVKMYIDSESNVKSWSDIMGPASACMATLGRIGWDVHLSNPWRIWIDRYGDEIDLAVFPIHSLKRRLHKDIQMWLWTQSTLYCDVRDKIGDHCDLGLWLDPTRSVIMGKDKLLGGMARSVAIGTQWTQSRLEQAGYAEDGDNKCRLCHEEVGTLLHRVGKDGCKMLAEHRKEYISLLDEAFADTHDPPLLRERALVLNSDKPRTTQPDRQLLHDPMATVDPKEKLVVKDSKHWGPNAELFDEDFMEWLNDSGKIFTDDTFVDGSGVIVREDDALSQCGLAVVSVAKSAPDEVLDKSENPDEPIQCACINSTNEFHVCSEWCTENAGCNAKCMAKKPEQKLAMGVPIQAAYGPLGGSIQTTPRAELMAIFVAIVFGRSPQRIISDHLNHVVALRDWMLHGDTSFLNPSYPNVDLWRRVHAAILRRGGLREAEGEEHNFTIIWQPSHTRASVTETQEMKHLRRGNTAADYFANLGRGLHPSVSDLLVVTKSRFNAVKNWVTWVAKAAQLQYDAKFGMCDHDRKDKTLVKAKGEDQRVRIPREAKVLRRMPWAACSLGTVEYTKDLWSQDDEGGDGVIRDPTVRSVVQMHAVASREGPLPVRSYLDKFKVTNTRSGANRRRLIPLSLYSEYDEPLPTDLSLGHHMMTCGLGEEQFFWCNLCCAYSGDRVRKLAKPCDRTIRNVPAVNKLRDGVHPWKGTAMTTRARRMVKADVGEQLALLDPSPCMHGVDVLARSDGDCLDHRSIVTGVLSCPLHHSLED